MKLIYSLPLAALFLFSNCGKKEAEPETPAPAPAVVTPTPDTNPPVISLKGNTNHTITLNSAYTEPGATAADNVDGDISSKVVVTGTVNKDLVGEYRLYYNVQDAAGNKAAQMTRYVYVKNDADVLVGSYISTPNCGATPTGGGTSLLSASSSANNEVSLNIPGNVSGITPVIKVNGNSIIIPMVSSASGTFVGNGTIATDKKSFVITYTASSASSIQGTRECTTNFNKQ